MRKILYLAAHGGFAGQAVPLGGGAAIANHLCEEWAKTRPFDLQLVGPRVLGESSPTARQLVQFNEREYASFCHAFREACTREVLRHDPRETAVLVNDVSEGPDFAQLAQAGFAVHTIWHVDVVAYISDIYLRGAMGSKTLARWWERLRGVGATKYLPGILQLIFEQQRQSLEHSRAVIVPSAGMREVIRRAYPSTPEGRVRVLGWGARISEWDDREVEAEALRLRAEFAVPDEARVLLCLSRISPEKGQDVLLKALRQWRGGPLWVFICGEAAFMQGEKHMAKLRRLARDLTGVEVRFPGYVAGLRKQAFFRMADLYVFPSRHESYGLTLMEALAAGVPAVCLDHHGARAVMREEFGAIVRNPRELGPTVARLLADPVRLREQGRAAAAYARGCDFSSSAGRLAEWLSEPHTARTSAGPI